MSQWHLEETYKSLIQISTVVMRFILLANGGAVIALLAFMGDVNSNGGDVPNFKNAIAAYLAGVLLGGLLCGVSYLTQLQLYRESRDRKNEGRHHVYLYVGIFIAFMGILSFGVGSWLAVNAYSF